MTTATLEQPTEEITVEAPKTTKVPMLDKAAAAVAAIAAKDDRQPVLTGVCIRDGELIATDGFMLMVCDLIHEEREGVAPDLNERIIPAKAVSAIAKRAKGPIEIIPTDHPGMVALGYVGPFGVETAEVRTIESNAFPVYPDATKIFPDADPTISVAIDGKLMITILKAMHAARKATMTSLDTVVMHIYDNGTHPIVFSTSLGDDPKENRRIDAMMMPMVFTDDAMTRLAARKGNGEYVGKKS